MTVDMNVQCNAPFHIKQIYFPKRAYSTAFIVQVCSALLVVPVYPDYHNVSSTLLPRSIVSQGKSTTLERKEPKFWRPKDTCMYMCMYSASLNSMNFSIACLEACFSLQSPERWNLCPKEARTKLPTNAMFWNSLHFFQTHMHTA